MLKNFLKKRTIFAPKLGRKGKNLISLRGKGGGTLGKGGTLKKERTDHLFHSGKKKDI